MAKNQTHRFDAEDIVDDVPDRAEMGALADTLVDRAAAVNERIGERSHFGPIRNVVDDVLRIKPVSLILGHRSLLEGFDRAIHPVVPWPRSPRSRGPRPNGLPVTVPAALEGTPRTTAWRHVTLASARARTADQKEHERAGIDQPHSPWGETARRRAIARPCRWGHLAPPARCCQEAGREST